MIMYPYFKRTSIKIIKLQKAKIEQKLINNIDINFLISVFDYTFITVQFERFFIDRQWSMPPGKYAIV